MYICICKGITDKDIRQAVMTGAGSYASVREQLGIASQCGMCARHTKDLVHDTLNQAQSNANGLLYHPA